MSEWGGKGGRGRGGGRKEVTKKKEEMTMEHWNEWLKTKEKKSIKRYGEKKWMIR